MFKNILLASDGSEHSIRAATRAIELAKLHPEAKVTVIYVVDGSTSKQDVLRHWDSASIGDKRKKQMFPIEELAEKSNVPYELKFLHGEPGPTIVQYAEQNPTDVIVIGSRGLNKFQEMVLGSVSHKVAKRATCPVMIVK
ncbi:universal stress protein [Bacillus fonticola]|uniref:universal stress protein n=1 Tax=Bacillus fonticola TaxID=2728853 RepID=UPI001475F209|nr:universal stress protein [Bacillus fonticola]